MARSRQRALAGALVVAVMGLVVMGTAGCGAGGGAADSATPSSEATATTEPATTTTDAPTEEEAILAAYHGYWDTWLAANSPPNP
ncbi:MAG TPA: hypothetical protein VIY72_14470, partial [Acidimicrobiales bacterium]